MPPELTLTVLVEDTSDRADLTAEHGLAVWVDTPAGNLLWDTGQGGALAGNAAVMGIDVATLDAVAISHGHYDHAGGLPEILKRVPGLTVWGHPGMFAERYVADDRIPGGYRAVGIPCDAAAVASSGAGLMLSRTGREVLPNIHLTGEIPRITGFERPRGFYIDRAGTAPDPIPDDQALVIETADGIAVLLGCAHAGVVNTLEAVRSIWPEEPICLVAGGMHLADADDARIDAVIAALDNFGIRAMCPGHCTGAKAVAQLATAFPRRVTPMTTGWRWRTALRR